jgi:hypothetical protein
MHALHGFFKYRIDAILTFSLAFDKFFLESYRQTINGINVASPVSVTLTKHAFLSLTTLVKFVAI